MTGTPQVSDLASFLVSLARELDASSIMIDGPQGWKAPDNGLEHSRICEGELHTPGKTGLPGETKPANYLPFIEFSIELFDKLAESGYPRLATTGSWPTHVAIESFPTAAWRSIGLAALPSKRKTTDADKEAALQALQSLYTLDVRGDLTHDELQATVAGLACVAHERGPNACCGEGVASNPVCASSQDRREGVGCQHRITYAARRFPRKLRRSCHCDERLRPY